MPDLITTYARSNGFLIDEPWMNEAFYPLPFTRYITLGTGSGQVPKCYDYYQEVLNILGPYLTKAGIAVVLLGAKEDPPLQGVHDLRGQTSLHQSYYLLRHALLHLGNDSWMAHASGVLKTPLVALYGSTDKTIHGPHWCGKVKLLESHRRGNKPSFSNESPKTVNLIDPFDVARAVLELLSIEHTITQKVLNVGLAYQLNMMEWLPNTLVNPQFNPHLPLAARYDLVPNEQLLLQALQLGRKMGIVTKSPINLQILAGFKDNILHYHHEIDESTPLDYVRAVRKIKPDALFFTRERDEKRVAAIRFHFFDVVAVQQILDKTRTEFETACREYLNQPDFSLDAALKSGKIEFRTNKYVLSNGKIYTSLAHEKANIALNEPGWNQMRDEDWWIHDMNHWLVYQT